MKKFEGRFRVYSTPDKSSRKHYLNVLSTNTDQPVISSRRFNEGLIVY
jgi:flagellum-specific peptidoglycan hydrolase FlgJ